MVTGAEAHLVNVMVNVLAGDDRSDRMALVGTALNALALELKAFLLKTSLDSFGVSVMQLFGLHRSHHVFMSLWEHLTILHRLDGCVEMILMNFTVDGCLSFLMTMF